MSRRSLADLTLVPLGREGASTRPPPPHDLDANEKHLWLELTAACGPSHFRLSDGPLLAAYVSVIGLHQRVTLALKSARADDIGALIAAQAAASRQMCSLSTKLRLNPQSRLSQAGASRRGSAPPSFYESMVQANAAGADASDAAAVEG
jgi:hypothetical protein